MNKSCSEDFFPEMVLTWRKKKHRVMQKWKVDVRTEKMTNATRSEFLTTKVVKIRLILWRSCALAFDPLHFHSKTIEVFSFIATCERSALWILEVVRRRLWNHFFDFAQISDFLKDKMIENSNFLENTFVNFFYTK